MDILRSWIDDTGKERAKIYHNIAPESMTIVNLELYFAHPGAYTPGGSTAGMYRIPLAGCPYITTDPEQIKFYLADNPDTINGICVTTINVKEETK